MDRGTAERVGRALGRIPSGCAVLTARGAGGRTGMLASWVQQTGFEPPMVSVAVKKGRPIEAVIDAAEGFVVNILGEDPTAMFKHFGRGFGPGEDAFAGLHTSDVPGGVLIESRVGWISAKVFGKYDAGDHWLYVGQVVDGDGEGDARPYVHLRKNGLNY